MTTPRIAAGAPPESCPLCPRARAISRAIHYIVIGSLSNIVALALRLQITSLEGLRGQRRTICDEIISSSFFSFFILATKSYCMLSSSRFTTCFKTWNYIFMFLVFFSFIATKFIYLFINIFIELYRQKLITVCQGPWQLNINMM